MNKTQKLMYFQSKHKYLGSPGILANTNLCWPLVETTVVILFASVLFYKNIINFLFDFNYLICKTYILKAGETILFHAAAGGVGQIFG